MRSCIAINLDELLLYLALRYLYDLLHFGLACSSIRDNLLRYLVNRHEHLHTDDLEHGSNTPKNPRQYRKAGAAIDFVGPRPRPR